MAWQLYMCIGKTRKTERRKKRKNNNGMRVNRMCLRCIIWQRVGKNCVRLKLFKCNWIGCGRWPLF